MEKSRYPGDQLYGEVYGDLPGPSGHPLIRELYRVRKAEKENDGKNPLAMWPRIKQWLHARFIVRPRLVWRGPRRN